MPTCKHMKRQFVHPSPYPVMSLQTSLGYKNTPVRPAKVNTFDELSDAECIVLNWEDEETFLNKLFLHSQRFRGQGIHYLMLLIAACQSDHEKPGQLPVSEVLMGRSRLGLMDIHNFFNSYVFEVRNGAIVTIQHL